MPSGSVSAASGAGASPRRGGVTSMAWWVRDPDGRLAVAQWPNPALAVWVVAVVVGATGVLGASLSAQVTGLGRGALVVWALDELVRGSSPFRRLLGAVVLTGQLLALVDGAGGP